MTTDSRIRRGSGVASNGGGGGPVSTTTTTSTRRRYGSGLTMNPLVDDGTIATTDHDLGVVPTGFRIVLTCLTADRSYAVGSQILLNESQPDRLGLWVTDSQFGGRMRDTPWIADAATANAGGTLTAGSWSMVITPYVVEDVDVVTGVSGGGEDGEGGGLQTVAGLTRSWGGLRESSPGQLHRPQGLHLQERAEDGHGWYHYSPRP